MNEYFELLHKGYNHADTFIVDVVVFLVLVAVIYSVMFTLEHRVLIDFFRMLRRDVKKGNGSNDKSEVKAANQSAHKQSKNMFAQNAENDCAKFVIIDAIVNDDNWH